MISKYWRRGWRKIPGFDHYRILKDGRIYSVYSDKFIAIDYNVASYIRVELYNKSGQRCRPFVHRLVGVAFRKNSDPKNKTQINHIDYNRHNNNSSNLEWCTRSVNMIHASNRYNTTKEYKGNGRWKEISYEESKLRAGTPF